LSQPSIDAFVELGQFRLAPVEANIWQLGLLGGPLQTRPATRQPNAQEIHSLLNWQRESAPDKFHQRAVAFLPQISQSRRALLSSTFFHAM
jgi:hypothetical protein